MKYINLLLLVACLFAACGPATPVRTQSLDCYLRYSQTEAHLRADVILKENSEGASARPVEMPGGIAYNGSAMTLIPRQGMTYKWEQDGGMPATHVFSWKNERGETQNFELPLQVLPDFGFESMTIGRDKAAQFQWAGASIDAGDSFIFLWEHPTHGTATMQISGSITTNSVEIPAAELSKLQPGEWSLYLVRKKVSRGMVGGMEIRAVAEFYSTTKMIKVI